MSKKSLAGVHVPEYKDTTSQQAIEQVALPNELFVPLHQHTGAPARSLVKPGQQVLKGEKIGDADSFITASVHSPVTGTVVAVEERPTFTGRNVTGVVIAVGPPEEQNKTLFGEAVAEWDKLSPADIRRIVREAGIVGLGGAAFPTHVKLSPPAEKPINTVIINGCECEPFLSCDYRLMVEETAALITGSLILKHTVGAQRVIFAIEDNKPEAIAGIKQAIASDPALEVVVLESKYPQGAEKTLVHALLGQEIPSGGLPMDVGALVHNVGTAIAIAQAVTEGKPLIERTLTVAGPGIARPCNVRVLIGTPISHVIGHAGGLKENVTRVIMGGPMTGWAQADLTVPVVKGTSGILALDESMVMTPSTYSACVRCGLCVEACPQLIYPNFIGIVAELGQWSKAEAEGVLDCVECGLCAFVCPGHRPLIRFVRAAKAAITTRRMAAGTR